MASGEDTDRLIRLAAFTHLGSLVRRFGDVVPWRELKEGVRFREGLGKGQGTAPHLVPWDGGGPEFLEERFELFRSAS